MSLFDGIDRPGHGLEMIKIYGRVRRLHKYRRIMRETIDLLRKEAALMRDMREMTNDIETLEQETKELWEEGGVEFMCLHGREEGNTSAEDGNRKYHSCYQLWKQRKHSTVFVFRAETDLNCYSARRLPVCGYNAQQCITRYRPRQRAANAGMAGGSSSTASAARRTMSDAPLKTERLVRLIP